jgi:hypothetical protein
VVNDPPASYQPANEKSEKSNTPSDDFGADSSPGNAQNEDDLPF